MHTFVSMAASLLFLAVVIIFNLVGSFVRGILPDTCDDISNSSIDSLSDAVKSAKWSCAREIITDLQSPDKATVTVRELKDVLSLAYRSIQDEFAGLNRHLENYQSINYISPAFQWAQSANDVLLNVKFAHKLDAPATLNVEASNVSLTEERLFMIASDGRKHFKLDLSFSSSVNPNASSWTMASVGRMTFSIRKAVVSTKWERLLHTSTRKPANMHMWWEMHDKYEDELEKLDTATRSEVPPSSVKNETTVAEISNSTVIDAAEENSVKEIKADDPADKAANADREAKKEAQEKLRQQMKDLEDEARKRKRQVDLQAKQDKQAIDEEIKARRKALEAVDVNTDASTKSEL